MYDPNQITYMAEADARNRRVTFGIKAEDRTKHMYIIGKTGMGKSTLLENMAAQDIRNGNGFAFMDPHGSAIDTLMQYIPKERIKDVIYFAPFDMEFPISFNVMEDVGFDKRHLVVSGLMSTFKKIWQDAWSARMEYILGNTLLALLEYPDATLLEVNKMLSDKEFRKKVVDSVTDHAVKSFWVDEFAKYTDRFAAEATPAIQNKIGQFTANPLIRNIIGQPKSSFDMRKLMDEKKILLVNLSKGRIGESNANLLGSMLITKMYLSALSRADVTKDEMTNLPNFYLYVDEFQSFANDSFADILSEARKYKLNLTIAHQYIEQMSEEVRAAVFGNVGTMVTFRVGAYDAEILEKEFAPVFTAEDIVNLGFTQIYLRLMIDGVGSKPFSAKTLAPLERAENTYEEEILGYSRQNYAKPRNVVEDFVKNLHGKNNSGNNNRGDLGNQQNSGNRNDNNRKNGSNHRNQNSKNDGSKSNKSQKTRTVINQDLKKELEKQLEIRKKEKIRMIEEEVNSEDLNNISLDEMTLNTKAGFERRQNQTNQNQGQGNIKNLGQKSKSATPEHRNALKEALSGLLAQKSGTENIPPKSNPELKSNTKLEEIPEEELRKILEV